MRCAIINDPGGETFEQEGVYSVGMNWDILLESLLEIGEISSSALKVIEPMLF